jgi:hypothetical protein
LVGNTVVSTTGVVVSDPKVVGVDVVNTVVSTAGVVIGGPKVVGDGRIVVTVEGSPDKTQGLNENVGAR